MFGVAVILRVLKIREDGVILKPLIKAHMQGALEEEEAATTMREEAAKVVAVVMTM